MARGFGATLGAGATDVINTGVTSHSTQRTWLASFNRNGAGGNSGGRIFDKNTGGVQSENLFWSNSATRIRSERYFTSGSVRWDLDLTATGTWYNLVMRYDSSAIANNVTAYSGGVAIAATRSTSSPSGSAVTTTDPYSIGNRLSDSARVWDGIIARFAIWDELIPDGYAAAISDGASPLIYPHGLIFFAPLIRDVINLRGAIGATTGTAVQPQPRDQYIDDRSSAPVRRQTITTIAPSPVTVKGSNFGAMPVQGAITVMPSVATSSGSGMNPTVVQGPVTVALSPKTAQAATVAPTVSITPVITLQSISSHTAVVNPAVVQGPVTVMPGSVMGLTGVMPVSVVLQLDPLVVTVQPITASVETSAQVLFVTLGKVVLKDKTLNGTLKVAFSTFSGDVISRNAPFDIVPMWRSLQSGESIVTSDTLPLAAEAFKLLTELTGDDQWRRVAQAAQYTVGQTTVPQTPLYFLRQEGGGQVLSVVGTRVINTNDNPLVTLRTSDGIVRLYGNNKPGRMIAMAQTEVLAILTDSNQIEATAGLSVMGVIDVDIRVNGSRWSAPLAHDGGTELVTQVFAISDFLQWTAQTYWNAANDSDTFGGLTGTATQSRINLRVGTQNWAIARFEMEGNFDTAGCRLYGTFDVTPSPITYSLGGAPITIRLQDGSGWYWQRLLPATGGQFVTQQFTWNEFVASAFQVNSGSPMTPDNSQPIQSIEFIASSEASVLSLYYVGNAPIRLSGLNIPIESCAIASRRVGQHILLVGDVLLAPAPSLPYSSVTAPAAWLVQDNDVVGWRGNPLIATPPYRNDMSQLLRDAQQYYWEVIGLRGPFAPSVDWLQSMGLGWQHTDYDLSWGGWQGLIGAIAAQQWHDGLDHEIVVMTWLNFLMETWGSGDAIALTHFPSDSPPLSLAIDVPIVALYGQAALYANLAGGDRALTFQILEKSLTYILTHADFSTDREPDATDAFKTAVLLKTLSLILLHKTSIQYPAPSDLGDRESDFAAKILRTTQFIEPLNLSKQASFGFRFTVPVVFED